MLNKCHHQIVSVQFSCSAVSDSLWSSGLHAARQASLSITNSQSLLKLWIHQIGDAIQPSHQIVYPHMKAPCNFFKMFIQGKALPLLKIWHSFVVIDTELCFWPLLWSWPKFHLNFSSLVEFCCLLIFCLTVLSTPSIFSFFLIVCIDIFIIVSCFKNLWNKEK